MRNLSFAFILLAALLIMPAQNLSAGSYDWRQDQPIVQMTDENHTQTQDTLWRLPQTLNTSSEPFHGTFHPTAAPPHQPLNLRLADYLLPPPGNQAVAPVNRPTPQVPVTPATAAIPAAPHPARYTAPPTPESTAQATATIKPHTQVKPTHPDTLIVPLPSELIAGITMLIGLSIIHLCHWRVDKLRASRDLPTQQHHFQ